MSEVVLVRIVAAKGSAPREVGAHMIVAQDNVSGTIGGGRLEYEAIRRALDLLSAEERLVTEDVTLGPELGQCCGGRVRLSYSRYPSATAAERATVPSAPRVPALIFGGGHVGRALASALAPLPFDVTVIESRPAYLKDLPERVSGELLAAPEAAVREAQPGGAVVAVTHEHAMDFLIVEEALRLGTLAYIGMIGSNSKKAQLARRLEANGLDAAPVTCPIGEDGKGDKRPEVIAAFTAAELLMKTRKP